MSIYVREKLPEMWRHVLTILSPDEQARLVSECHTVAVKAAGLHRYLYGRMNGESHTKAHQARLAMIRAASNLLMRGRIPDGYRAVSGPKIPST